MSEVVRPPRAARDTRPLWRSPSALPRAVDEHPLGEETLDEIERQVRRRRADPAFAPSPAD